MKEELKTLKDLEEELRISTLGVESDFSDKCILNWLKAEAVKWVKQSRELIKDGFDGELNEYSWLKFFNLTEENLK